MSDGRSPDVVVVGGAAGAAIAHRLAELGKRVALLWRNDIKGATDNNQKVLHSGLLYPSGRLAERAWSNRNLDWALKRPYLVGPERAYILALTDETLSARSRLWTTWAAQQRPVPEALPLDDTDRQRLKSLGVRFAGGWTTRDCVINFPALFRDMRLNVAGQLRQNDHFPKVKVAANLMEGAKVLRLRRGPNGITGVDYESNGDQRTLVCDQCVLAAGAWSYELLRDIDVDLPLVRKKCLVLAFKSDSGTDGRSGLDRITVWLDVKKEDGTRADFTLVPFETEVLAAGTDFRVVYQLAEPPLEHLTAGPSEIAALHGELVQCFEDSKPRPFRMTDFEARTCFKTEQYKSAHPDVEVKVYTESTGLLSGGHGVRGLTVAIPGKASLIFDLARAVAKHVV